MNEYIAQRPSKCYLRVNYIGMILEILIRVLEVPVIIGNLSYINPISKNSHERATQQQIMQDYSLWSLIFYLKSS